jgi:hypothetical protein
MIIKSTGDLGFQQFTVQAIEMSGRYKHPSHRRRRGNKPLYVLSVCSFAASARSIQMPIGNGMPCFQFSSSTISPRISSSVEVRARSVSGPETALIRQKARALAEIAALKNIVKITNMNRCFFFIFSLLFHFGYLDFSMTHSLNPAKTL